jgi:DNA-binding MarR family transcriptional regulator
MLVQWIQSGYRLEGRLESVLTALGLSLSQLNVLTHLATARGSMTLGEIAAKLSCVRSNVTQLVDRLESEGLVRRLADPSDRRTVRAELTELGRQKQEEGTAALDRTGRELVENLPAGDLAALVRLSGALK